MKNLTLIRPLIIVGLLACGFSQTADAAQPDWVQCWLDYVDLFSGSGQGWADAWTYDGTCAYGT